MSRTTRTRIAACAALVLALGLVREARAWDVRCAPPLEPDEICPDPFARAQTEWTSHPLAEHRRLLAMSIELGGLPEALTEPYELTVYTGSDALEIPVYDTIRPVRNDAERERVRRVTLQMFANLPDLSYTLWDWASGNELCPPDPGNASAFDCHNYETHIGWLNSQHMLPQARHWYAYLHSLALERAETCAELEQRFDDPLQRTRFLPWLKACEMEALTIEAVGHHYLQDAWAAGHMMERWGSTEIADFGGDRALGFAVSGFVGALHGSKAMLDDDATLGPHGPWDDPINAPHADVGYIDSLDGPVPAPRPGVGDRFLGVLLGEVPGLADYGAQREALFGCAVDGLREVYAATGRLHGDMTGVSSGVDTRRSVDDDSCWAQRVTNRSFDTGLGVHNGAFTEPAHQVLGGPMAWTVGDVLGDFLLGAPQMDDPVKRAFQRDIGYVSTIAALRRVTSPDEITMAGGGAPSLAGIGPNSRYARGGAGEPPASYSDPPLPWTLADSDPLVEQRKQALALTFADAHAADRCGELTVSDLEAYRAAVASAPDDPEAQEARCGQCAQMVAPHLRFGVEGDFDDRRDAFCALALEPGSAPAFVFTGEDPGDFTGVEPTDLESLLEAAVTWCGCEGLRIEASLPDEVGPGEDVPLEVLVREAFGDRAPVPGALVELFTSGGSVGASAGVTGADGVFATTAQADGSDSFLTVDVEARLEDAGPVLATGQARALVTQPVNGCSPGDYVDRTDAAASRAITINFGFNPRCMIVKEGQQVTYQSGSAVNHPIEGDHLGGSLGDFQRNVGSSPSAVGLDEPGDYAVDCKAHPTERSALRVVP